MSTIFSLRNYVHGIAQAETSQEKPTASGRHPFVTVSRQAGAGGHTLSKALLQKIASQESDPLFSNWACLDEELCRQVAEDPALKVDIDNLLEERYRNSIEDYFLQVIAGRSPQLIVHQAVYKIIRSVAGVGKAVIVGRGGNFITRGYPRGIHIRLIAPLEDRIEAMARHLSISEKEAAQKIREIDSGREALIRDYFKADINDPLQYDAVFNTSSCSIDLIASAIVDLIKRKSELKVDEKKFA